MADLDRVRSGLRRSSCCTSILRRGPSASTTRRSARASAATREAHLGVPLPRRPLRRRRDPPDPAARGRARHGGPAGRHGPKWATIAADLGYVGRRTHDGEVAHELAPVGRTVPRGHEHFRYREPQRPLSCGLCRRGFDRANLIVWRHREITPAVRRRAASAAPGIAAAAGPPSACRRACVAPERMRRPPS